ncbi:tyrosine-protein phosphatase non-receptor type 23 isoform X2 [Drosophila mojavensis]|uniref:tyrosine-protein phosphatase non-receptor type 23 isoform X2 n=1 Tax=Drosophila mojavensis TaxID=7230 RepID=UPI0013EE77DC|nr:tyrosine-protein phosphatase non-receptor type 23 isoform X2 [Drosophila mojavensis]
MEAVPRLHMLWFALKSSPEGTSFAPLKKYIAEFYHEDPEAFSKEVHALETLRNQAMRTTKDGAPIMKRYYCQLHALQNRFPQLAERSIFTFTWKDLYHNTVHEVSDLRYERAAVLFNIAASHTQSGASVTRGDIDGMKMACTHFQAAAWAYNELRERYANVNSGTDFMTNELLVFQQQVCLAQAQECILEKSLIDNRKPHIVAKVTAQIVVYYGAALAALLTGGDDGPIAQVIESSVYKLWKKYVKFKINYLNCILYLYRGQQAEEQRKMGERLTLYQAAWDKLEEARKESKGLPDQKEINESLSFTADVVEGKRKNAKNENEFIYHEAVPELSTIPAVQGANLVNGIGFSVTDEEYAGTDIFARLVPMKAHEASSMYSEEKAKLLRKYGALLEEKDAQLDSYMSSLTLDNLNINEEQANKLPQGIVDRCAALHANKTAISDLIEAMSQLAEITADVETNLSELTRMLEAEAQAEREFQAASGVQRTPNAHITELTREFQKYSEAHARAGESNNTLRKAMSLHVNNLKILARPLQEIQQLMPKLSSELNTTEIFKDVKLIVNKVNEMKAQRAQFHADLRIAINEDDITTKVIAHGGQEGLQALFATELAKHDRLTQLLDQNMLAQQNILQALTEAYARAAPVLKTLQDVKQKREHFYSSLAASYDVYEDLLAKSAKGLEFYKKLAGNVQKLLTRFKSARDVQSEERQQRLQSVKAPAPSKPEITPTPSSGAPKLRDYLKAKQSGLGAIPGTLDATPYVPTVRPVPVGSENPTQAACSAYATAPPPNEPPPPYSLQHQQYYDPNGAGYTNPIYQQQQQHIAPPAYKAQASPNSQSLHSAMAQLSMQSQHQQQSEPPVASYGQQTPLPYGYNYPLANAAPGGSSASQNYNYQQPLYMATSTQPGETLSYAQPQPQQPQSVGYAPQSTQQSAYPAVGAATPQQQQQMSMYPQPAAGYSQTSQTLTQPAVSYPQTQTGSYPQTQTSQQPGTYPQMTTSQPSGSYPQTQTSQQPGSYPQTQTSQQATNYPQTQTPQQPVNYSSPHTPQQSGTYPQTQTPQQAGSYPQSLTPQPQQAASYPQSSTPQQAASYPQALNSQQPASYPQTQTSQQPTSYPQTQTSQQPTSYPQTQTPQQPASYPQSSQQSQIGAYPAATPPQPVLYPSQAAAQPTPTAASAPTQYPVGSAVPGIEANNYLGYSNHPGYSFNPQTGLFEYSSGYQHDTNSIPKATHGFGQFTQSGQQAAVVGTTDSEQANRSSLATGFDSPIVSHAKATNEAQATGPSAEAYYTPPYGYHSSGGSNTLQQQQQQPQQQQQQPQQQPQQQQPQQQPVATAGATTTTNNQKSAIYMQSGGSSIANTQTTTSSAPYASSTLPAATKPTASEATNVDLLSDLDLDSAGAVPLPLLQPQIVTTPTPPASVVGSVAAGDSSADAAPATAAVADATAGLSPVGPPPSMVTALRKNSIDNLSINSDLSSLDNFDWDSVSLTHSVSEKQPTAANGHTLITFQMRSYDPFGDDKTLKYFHKEVESYEKLVENLHVKMLNGNTQLSSKWLELQQKLEKDTSVKRTTTIAKLFPEKNRSLDCLPYDHARVKLDKQTDDYINAAYMKSLSAGCPSIIVAQTPQANTINDFWSMIWSEKSRTVLCLHTTNELFDPYWPQLLNQAAHYDDYTVNCIKIQQLSHCTEYQLKLSMHGADAVLDLSLLQLKQWTKASPTQLLGIAQNALQTHQERCLDANTPASPLILNCLTGSERCELLAIAICALVGTQNKRPILINVVDVWSRICMQRQNSLRDAAIVEQSMQIVLSHAHEVLNKRGIITSYQMKMAPQVTAKEQQETKDPLNELDALWKLK